jgi:two-component system, sensor histidine kinase and response regulator
VTHANPAMVRAWGRDPTGIGPDRYRDYPARFAASGKPIDGDDWPVLRAIRHGEPILDEELEIDSPTGTARTILVSGVPVRDEEGRLVGAVTVNQDITERKRFERDLAQARDDALAATRLKTAFLANVSHEIRTPLNVILGYNSLIAERLHELRDASSEPLLQAVERGGKRLLATIHRILDVARLETRDFEVRPEVIDLAPLIERHARDYLPLAQEKGLELDLRLDEREARIRFDEYCLAQSLRNLLDNAVKFTESGRITVTLDRDPRGDLRLEVADTGVGIDPSFQKHLFEPFSQEEVGHTRHFEGKGLGLSLVKRYLDRNGASLTVRSEKGNGATFTIRFTRDHEVRE